MQLNDTSLLTTAAYINGEWNAGVEQFSVFNPATGECVAKVADLSGAEAEQAIVAAHAAQQQWRQVSALERSNILWKLYELLLQHQEDLAKILTAEQGKPLAEAKGEIAYGAAYFRWFAEQARQIQGDVIHLPQADRRGIVLHQPVGVVAAITPWNFPNAMAARKLAPALAAGCSLVLKPAEATPLSALALAVLAERAGVPAGVFNVVTGLQAAVIGQQFSTHTLVRKITFTGSTAVGQTLLQQAASTMKRTSMELGGNAPILVFADADLDKAVQGTIAAKFRASGQTCICVNRVLVEASVYQPFMEKLLDATRVLKVGNGVHSNVDIGPLINQRALTAVHQKVEMAIEQGARLLLGGQPSVLGGLFYEPTVLADVQPQMAVWQQEIFGPVLPVMAFTTEAQAVALANDTDAGLAAYVYTQNMSRCWRLGETLDFGMVGMNETAISSEQIPFGGMKHSGHGREGSQYGLAEYLDTKYLCLGGL